jgi:hypothetical protein
MVRTQILLTEEQAARLRELAISEGKSMAELVRQGVDYILQARPLATREERQQWALSVVGQFSADTPDLARDHDRYLAEAYAS